MMVVIFKRTEEQNREEKRLSFGCLLVYPVIFVAFFQPTRSSEVLL